MFSKKRSFEIVLKTCFRVGIGTKPCRTHTISLRPVYLLDTSLLSQVKNTSSSKVNGEETRIGAGCTELNTLARDSDSILCSNIHYPPAAAPVRFSSVRFAKSLHSFSIFLHNSTRNLDTIISHCRRHRGFPPAVNININNIENQMCFPLT